MTFSDGEPLTADDVIFSMYVLADPTYDGSSTFFAQPIKGMADYRSGMDTLFNLMFAAGKDNTDFALWDEATQKDFWTKYDAATKGLAEEIVAYCVDGGDNEEGDIQGAAGNWGFEIEDNTIEAFQKALEEAYGSDVAGMISTEAAGSTVDDLFPGLEDYTLNMITVSDPVANISGIKKTGDYSMTVHTTKVDATAIYQLGVAIAPLHYYGETAKYDYDNNKFGFDKGDLSHVRSVTTKPLGAGPYKFVKFENKIVNFEANDSYYLGTPKTKFINFQEVSDTDKLNGVVTGTIDITDPSFSTDAADAIKEANGNDDIVGDIITTNTVDNLGYGYLGIDADIVNINGEKGSEASKNLRKGLATVFALYRELTVASYYGLDRASVINYPISNTSWAAPQPTDADYKVAFSTDVNGNDIYTSDMDDAAKEEAALKAALGYFEAAGFTVTDGKLTAAPEGFKGTGANSVIEYEAWIPADGSGDHPSFMLLTEAAKSFEKIGVHLIVKDLSNSSELWTALDANQVPVWCAAWGASVDPDMYQIYFSGDATNAPGGSNYMYGIDDPELNSLILDARASIDQAYRKTAYKACLDIIVDWATEIPVYQRQNAIIFSTKRVNMDTVTPDITTFYGWMSEIEKIELN
jgi:peptide/nickel transport system substrate-binding protein